VKLAHLSVALGSGLAFSLGCNTDTGLIAPSGAGGAAAGQVGQGGATAGAGSAGTGGKSAEAGTAGSSVGGTSGGAAQGGAAGAGALGGSGGGSAVGGKAGSTGTGGSSGRDSAGTGGVTESGGTSGLGSGGTSGLGAAGDDGDPPDEEIPEGFVKGIIGVGYGGIRILSRDGGETWGDRVSLAPSGGDDDNLIRAVAYGKGRWIATGWNLWTSDNGLDWASHGKLRDGIIDDQVIVEGLAYTNGYFYAAGDGNPSRLYRSPDGLEWEYHAAIGNTVKHTGLAYRGGRFVSFGDSHTSYESTDGENWSEMMGVEDATYCEGAWRSLSDCHDAAWFDDGFYLTVEWGGEILRSTTGDDFETVYRDDEDNTLYKSCAVAEGYVAP